MFLGPQVQTVKVISQVFVIRAPGRKDDVPEAHIFCFFLLKLTPSLRPNSDNAAALSCVLNLLFISLEICVCSFWDLLPPKPIYLFFVFPFKIQVCRPSWRKEMKVS